jgi:hypothetical protein
MSAGGLVELALHDPLAEVHHGDVHAAQLQAVGRLQPEQAGADHHRVRYLPAASIIASVSAMSR